MASLFELLSMYKSYVNSESTEHVLPQVVISKINSLPHETMRSRFSVNNVLIRKLNMISDTNYDTVIQDIKPLISKYWDKSIDLHFIQIVSNQKLHLSVYVSIYSLLLNINPTKITLLRDMLTVESHDQQKNIGTFMGIWIQQGKKTPDWAFMHELIEKYISVLLSCLIVSFDYLKKFERYNSLQKALIDKLENSHLTTSEKMLKFDFIDLLEQNS